MSSNRSHRSIETNVLHQRRERLMESLTGDGFLVFSNENADPQSLFYLSGFTGEGALILSPQRSALLTDRRYTEVARGSISDLEVIDVERDYLGCISHLVRRWKICRLAVAETRVTYGLVRNLQQAVDADVVPIEDPVASLRMVKDEEEISRIREAIQLTEHALDSVLSRLCTGCSERALAVNLEFEIRRQGAEGVAFAPIVASGPNSANAHHEPGDRSIQNGDLLLIDIGAQLDHYCADFTRMYAVGRPSMEAEELYQTVYEAQLAARKTLFRGANTSVVTETVHHTFIKRGYPGPLSHGVGHGVGLNVHEIPELSGNPTTLRANAVLAVEPGLYRTGIGGVRIEEMYRVRENGVDCLTVPASPSLLRIDLSG